MYLNLNSKLIIGKKTGNVSIKLIHPFDFHLRLFRLQLYPSRDSVFTRDVVFENTLGPIEFNSDQVYSGFLEGDISLMKYKADMLISR